MDDMELYISLDEDYCVLGFFIGLYNGVVDLFILECRGCYCCLWSQYKDHIIFVLIFIVGVFCCE